MGKRNQKKDREDISTDIAVSPFDGKLGHPEIKTISTHLHFLAYCIKNIQRICFREFWK